MATWDHDAIHNSVYFLPVALSIAFYSFSDDIDKYFRNLIIYIWFWHIRTVSSSAFYFTDNKKIDAPTDTQKKTTQVKHINQSEGTHSALAIRNIDLFSMISLLFSILACNM